MNHDYDETNVQFDQVISGVVSRQNVIDVNFISTGASGPKRADRFHGHVVAVKEPVNRS